MLDCHQVVSKIRRALASQLVLPENEFSALSDGFSALCHLVNQRLARCEEFLRQGNRSEAVRLCELEPNLLTMANALNFPERPNWEGYVQQMGLPLPPLLMLETAAELNAAYGPEQELASLLSTFRRLNLERAPLGDRVAVLRKMVERDPESAVWVEDLRQHEAVWLGELERDANRFLQARDLEAFERVFQDVTSPKWMTPPPSRFVQAVVQTRQRLKGIHAREAVDRFAAAFRQAYSQLQIEEARRLRELWNRFMAENAVAADDPALASVQEALYWLSQVEETGQFPSSDTVT